MNQKAKVIIAAVLALAAAGAGVYGITAPISVETVTLAQSTGRVTFTEQGVYGYDRSYTVYSLVSGEVLGVNVKTGDTVRAGDVLAVVDAVDYREQIEQLEAGILGYNGQLANLNSQDQQLRDSFVTQYAALRGQLATLRAEKAKSVKDGDSLEAQIGIQDAAVDLNRRAVERALNDWRDARDYEDDVVVAQLRQAYEAAQNALKQSELLLEQLKSGGVPEELFDAQEEAIRIQADAIIEQANKSYTSGMRQYYNAQIESANLTIAQLEERAGHAEIRATVGGVIESLPLRDQNVISRETPAAVIGSGAYVEVFVPIREIDSVSVGTRVELVLDKRLGEETATGTVVEVADEAEIKLSPLGVEERKIRVLIDPDEKTLQIGYTVDVSFTVWERENVLTAPKTAIFQIGGADYVWCSRDARLSLVEIEKGVEFADSYLVVSGLSQGDVIVLDANNTALKEGKAIAIDN